MANQNQGQGHGSGRSGTQNRGFASMSEADQREIARMGGAAVSEDREHMAAIGRRGGEASAEARAAQRSAARGESVSRSSGTTRTTRPRNDDGTFADSDRSDASGERGDGSVSSGRGVAGSGSASSNRRDRDDA
jgi:hypothetical protein